MKPLKAEFENIPLPEGMSHKQYLEIISSIKDVIVTRFEYCQSKGTVSYTMQQIERPFWKSPFMYAIENPHHKTDNQHESTGA